MKWTVYILKSYNHPKTYVGSSNNLTRRLEEHNSSIGSGTLYTSRYKPWKVVYTEEFDNEELARRRERYYKSSAGRRKIKNHIPL